MNLNASFVYCRRSHRMRAFVTVFVSEQCIGALAVIGRGAFELVLV